MEACHVVFCGIHIENMEVCNAFLKAAPAFT